MDLTSRVSISIQAGMQQLAPIPTIDSGLSSDSLGLCRSIYKTGGNTHCEVHSLFSNIQCCLGAPGIGAYPVELARDPFPDSGTQQLPENSTYTIAVLRFLLRLLAKICTHSKNEYIARKGENMFLK